MLTLSILPLIILHTHFRGNHINAYNLHTCINPILSGLWNYVTERGGAIMARMDSSHPEAVSRHPKAQK